MTPKTTNTLRMTKGILFTSLFFLAFFLAGLFVMLFFGSNNSKYESWTKTDSQISSIKEETVYVAYDATNTKGEHFHYDAQKLNEYSSDWTVGKIVPIKYNPNNTSEIVSDTAFSNVIVYVAGGIFMAVGLVGVIGSSIKTYKQYHNHLKEEATNSENTGERRFVDVASNNTVSVNKTINKLENGQKEYFMSPDSKIVIHNFSVHDLYNSPIVECKRSKFVLVGTVPLMFYNHKSKQTYEHKIGGVISTGRRHDDYALDTNKYFSLDGENVWKLLYKKGFKITCQLDKTIDVYKNNELIGHIRFELPSGPTSMVSAFKSLAHIGEYKLICKEEDIDDIFLIAICINYLSRSNSSSQ